MPLALPVDLSAGSLRVFIFDSILLSKVTCCREHDDSHSERTRIHLDENLLHHSSAPQDNGTSGRSLED